MSANRRTAGVVANLAHAGIAQIDGLSTDDGMMAALPTDRDRALSALGGETFIELVPDGARDRTIKPSTLATFLLSLHH